MIECVPGASELVGKIAATAAPPSTIVTGSLPNVVLPSEKVTDPVGIGVTPTGPATVAVKITWVP